MIYDASKEYIPAEVRQWEWELRQEKNRKKREEESFLRDRAVSDELVRWMTEGTDPRLSPRSDCG